MDLRNYGIGAQILRDLNVGRMRLLAKPRKMPSMAGFDLEVDRLRRAAAARRSRRRVLHARDRSCHDDRSDPPEHDGDGRRVGIVLSRFNPPIGDGLLAGALRALRGGRRRRRRRHRRHRARARWNRRSRCSGSRRPATTTRWSRWAR